MKMLKLTNKFQFAYPICRNSLGPPAGDSFWCAQDETAYARVDGVWRFLRPDRERHFHKFIQEYETVRGQEQRGSDDPDYYRSLPYLDKSWPLSHEWVIRAKSFKALVREVIAPLEESRKRELKILDLGAGNGWLSNRLAGADHAVVAVDLITNSLDGLGTHRYYEKPYLPVQSEFDYLPFGDGQFDLAVFNASFHYAESYETTLVEALRVLLPGASVVILDTPIYRDADSGRQMVQEREATFERLYGFPSNTIQSENYLTYQRLEQLAQELQLNWNLIKPFYGWRWALRPLKARLLGRREPAKFILAVGERLT